MLKKSLIINLGFALAGALIAVLLMQSVNHASRNNVLNSLEKETPSPSPSIVAVTSNEDPQGDRSLFHFSPNKQHIAFIENVFAEYGNDYDRYYAITVFDVESREERRIFIGTYKTSSFEWLDGNTIRVYLNAGTGVRAYRDVAMQLSQPIVFKDYLDRGEGIDFWIPNQEYVQEVRDVQRAQRTYWELSDK